MKPEKVTGNRIEENRTEERAIKLDRENQNIINENRMGETQLIATLKASYKRRVLSDTKQIGGVL